MTNADLDQLDAAVAEKVMGLVRDPVSSEIEGDWWRADWGTNGTACFSPTRDPGDNQRLKKRMIELGYSALIDLPHKGEGNAECGWYKARQAWQADDESELVAVCLAAVEAMG